jgi:hypothetical protein
MRVKKAVMALAASIAGFALSAPALAAYISIDDSDPSTITITAGDFEGGFSVDGNLITTGLFESGSITLADGGHSIDGSWIDLGQAGNARIDLYFALPGNPNFTTSGIEFGTTTDGFMATLSGSFGGYIDPSNYFSTPLPTLAQNGQTGFSGVPFLSVSFTSESVPEPTTLALMGLGLAGMVFRKKARAAPISAGP